MNNWQKLFRSKDMHPPVAICMKTVARIFSKQESTAIETIWDNEQVILAGLPRIYWLELLTLPIMRWKSMTALAVKCIAIHVGRDRQILHTHTCIEEKCSLPECTERKIKQFFSYVAALNIEW